MRALILAAGLGTRLRPITDNLPKAMVPINGKPCLQYAIENLKNQGITELAINTHYFPEEIKSYFGDGLKFGVKIKYSFEPEILGTSGALNNFRDFFKERFIVIYGDVLANFVILSQLKVHEQKKAIVTMALDSKREMTNKGAVFIDSDKKVTGFVEKPGKEISGAYINSGCYIIEPTIIKHIPKGFSDFGKDILPELVKSNKVFAFHHKGYIIDIGNLEDLKKAESFFKENKISI